MEEVCVTLTENYFRSQNFLRKPNRQTLIEDLEAEMEGGEQQYIEIGQVNTTNDNSVDTGSENSSR